MPEQSERADSSQVPRASVWRELTNTFSNIRNVSEVNKMIRVSNSLLRFMLFLDLCYLITGISLITVGLTNKYFNREQMIVCGGAFGVVASVCASCNSLAAHGVRTWRRGFLLPWLIFYMLVLIMSFTYLCRSFYFYHLNLKQVFLFMTCFILYATWRHFQKMYVLMANPRPAQVVVDVEAVVRDLVGLQQQPDRQTDVSKDLPPKYEEVEDLPPQYDAAMMSTNTVPTVSVTISAETAKKP